MESSGDEVPRDHCNLGPFALPQEKDWISRNDREFLKREFGCTGEQKLVRFGNSGDLKFSPPLFSVL